MSRRDNKPDLSKIIDAYKESKDEENRLHKINDETCKTIKSYMQMLGVNTADGSEYTANLSITQKESLNNDLAIEILKANLDEETVRTVIKSKEYIDEDALEKLVYAGLFDITKLAKAKIVKNVSTLRITKRK
nr:MAG TPA: hypothetical protein [Caudoviricetes sp.]